MAMFQARRALALAAALVQIKSIPDCTKIFLLPFSAPGMKRYFLAVQ
jgi:hypothetical protein